jgi:uncharacterized SAM-dependent methyltransferase
MTAPLATLHSSAWEHAKAAGMYADPKAFSLPWEVFTADTLAATSLDADGPSSDKSPCRGQSGPSSADSSDSEDNVGPLVDVVEEFSEETSEDNRGTFSDLVVGSEQNLRFADFRDLFSKRKEAHVLKYMYEGGGQKYMAALHDDFEPYYVARSEHAFFKNALSLARVTQRILAGSHAEETRLWGPRTRSVHVVEFGPGSKGAVELKTIPMLADLERSGLAHVQSYIGVDIQKEYCADSVQALRETRSMRALEKENVGYVVSDFFQPDCATKILEKQAAYGIQREDLILVVLLGQTLGNFQPYEMNGFFSNIKSLVGGTRCEVAVAVGVDTNTDNDALLHAAYDNHLSQALTRTVLKVLDVTFCDSRSNLPEQLFTPGNYFDVAFRVNKERSRIEQGLKALRDVKFTLDGETFDIKAGTFYVTITSKKFTKTELIDIYNAHGFEANLAKDVVAYESDNATPGLDMMVVSVGRFQPDSQDVRMSTAGASLSP